MTLPSADAFDERVAGHILDTLAESRDLMSSNDLSWTLSLVLVHERHDLSTTVSHKFQWAFEKGDGCPTVYMMLLATTALVY